MGPPTRTPSTRRLSLTAPIVLITLGVMFLLDEVLPGWSIRKTWPLLLVVIGILKLLDSARPPQPPRGPNA